MSKDWTKLPAGRELDRAIAGLSGWRFNADASGDAGVMIAPDGESSWFSNLEGTLGAILPGYSTNLGSAFMLLSAFAVWHITKMGTGRIVVDLYDDGKGMYYSNEQQIEPLALAICRAWLTWKKEIG